MFVALILTKWCASMYVIYFSVVYSCAYMCYDVLDLFIDFTLGS